MQAGKLRNQIVIQTPTDAQDTQGNLTQTWATHATVWAAIRPLSGVERVEGGQVGASLRYEFEIRYLSTVTPKMRISWDSRYFDIESVANVDTRNHNMILTANERVQ